MPLPTADVGDLPTVTFQADPTETGNNTTRPLATIWSRSCPPPIGEAMDNFVGRAPSLELSKRFAEGARLVTIKGTGGAKPLPAT